MGPLDPYRCQTVWFNLEQELGEKGARKELARLLWEAAEHHFGDTFPAMAGVERREP